MTTEKRQRRLIEVAKELKVGLNTIQDFLRKKNIDSDGSPNSIIPHEAYALLKTQFAISKFQAHNNEQSRISITRLGTIKFYDAIKNFGYIIDTLEGREYYFTMNISDSSLIRHDVRSRIGIQNTAYNAPALNTHDTVSFNLTQVRHNGQVVYNAVHLLPVSILSAHESSALVSFVSDKFNQETLRKFKYLNIHRAIHLLEIWLIRSIRIIRSESDYERIQLILKYYNLNLSVNGQELQNERQDRISCICLFAPITYQYRLWIERWIATQLPDSTVMQYIRQGMSIEQCLNKLGKEQAARIYQQYIQDNTEQDYIRLSNIWNKRFGFRYGENIETLLQNKIKERYSDDQLYQLASDGNLFLLKMIPISFFLKTQFPLSKLDIIYRNVDFSKEEEIEIVCNADGLLRDKIKFLKEHDLFDHIELNQLLLKLSASDADKLNLWEAGHIRRPFSKDELCRVIMQCDIPTHHIETLKEKGKIVDSEYKELCLFYIQNRDLQIPADLEWAYSHLQDWLANEENPWQYFKSDTTIALEMVKWVKDNDCEGYKDEFCRFFHLLSETDQAIFLRKIIELHRIDKLKLSTKYLLNLVRYKSNINLSVYIVIEVLCKLKSEHRFLSHRELYDILHKIAPQWNNQYKSLSLSLNNDLFDSCPGRIINSFKWASDHDKLSSASFDIHIDMEQKTSYITLPPNGEPYKERTNELRAQVNGIRYDSAQKKWETSANAYGDITAFAKQFPQQYTKSIVRLSKGGLTFNYLLAYMTESYLAERNVWKNPTNEEYTTYKEFWDRDIYWCYGKLCLNNCLHLKPQGKYYKYTLYDFITILNLSTKTGHDIEVDLSRFYSFLNWFDKAIEHLYCRECSKILEASEKPWNYKARALSMFYCANEECQEYRNDHYITHCFRKHCHAVIDDRDAKKCPNGLVICKECGACCGETQNKNKEELGPTNAKKLKLHFEQKMFYCPFCGEQLVPSKEKESVLCCTNHPDYKVDLLSFREFRPKQQKQTISHNDIQ